MFKPRLSVVYAQTASGRRSLAAAARLFGRSNSERLRILTEEQSSAGAELNSIQRERIRLAAAEATGIEPQRLDIVPSRQAPFDGESDLLVACEAKGSYRFGHVSVLVTFDELPLERNEAGPVIIPFGNGESGLHAASFALTLASGLSLPVALYHTTWRNPALDPAPPTAHMCPAALDVETELERRASELALEHDTTVEAADDVVEGLIRFALRRKASLIAMARGRKTGRSGSYVTQTLAQSPVPVLIVGRQPAGGAPCAP